MSKRKNLCNLAGTIFSRLVGMGLDLLVHKKNKCHQNLFGFHFRSIKIRTEVFWGEWEGSIRLLCGSLQPSQGDCDHCDLACR